jgi:serine/threonine-protein kinase
MSDSETRAAREDGSLLSHVIASYLDDADRLSDPAGRQRLRDEYLAANPQLAARLQSHFEDEDVIGRTLRPVGHIEPRLARYSQLSKIGHGAMGVVYKGFDEELKRWVALKVAIVDDDAPGEARRIRAEAESMARLTHRNIVKVYDVRAEGGSTVISMELVPDGSLEDHLRDLAGDPRAIARLMVDLARAVHHAHQRGIIHRDLKPANVLLARDEHGAFHPYVSDFGLAKPMDAADSHGTGPQAGAGTMAYGRIVGTASYMSPEQAAGNRATTLSDVYSLGGILYALLAGRAPFRGETAGETLALVRDPARQPQPPSAIAPGTDRTLAAICLTCLKKDPELRYRSAEGLARDLERWLAHRPTDARRLGVAARAALWARRTPLGAVLLVTLLALGVMSGIELADRLAAPRRARLAVAQQTAALLVSRLADIKRAVEATAARPGLAAQLQSGDVQGLQAAIEEEGGRHDDLDGTSPFASLFVIDARDGAMVARWPTPDPESKGVDFRLRNYYRGLLASDTPGAHVSQAFRGVTDQLFRFGVSARLVHQDRTVGVVVATVTTDDRMGLADVRHEFLVTSVLARRDPNPLPGEIGPTQEDASPYVILLHPAYVLGIEPRWLPRRYLDDLAGGEAAAYRDPVADLPVAAASTFRGTWVATFAPIEGTDFVVAVQQR